jgi:Tfp pilus assembly protein PilF
MWTRHETETTLSSRSEERSKLRPSQTADVQIAFAKTLERQDKDEDAIRVYKEAVKNDPSRADAHLRLAVLHDKSAKFAESAAYYQKALAASPGDPEVFCDKGYSLYLQRKLPDAEAALRQAIALKPDFPRAHNNLGLVLGHARRSSEALAEFRKAGNVSQDAHLNLAFVMTLDERWDEARKEYNVALAIDPASEPAKTGLKELDRLHTRVPALARAVQSVDSAVVPASATAPAAKKAADQSSTTQSKKSRGRRRLIFGNKS